MRSEGRPGSGSARGAGPRGLGQTLTMSASSQVDARGLRPRPRARWRVRRAGRPQEWMTSLRPMKSSWAAPGSVLSSDADESRSRQRLTSRACHLSAIDATVLAQVSSSANRVRSPRARCRHARRRTADQNLQRPASRPTRSRASRPRTIRTWRSPCARRCPRRRSRVSPRRCHRAHDMTAVTARSPPPPPPVRTR